MLSVSFQKISKYVYFLVLLALVIDIGGGLGIKYAISGLLLIWVAVLIAKYGMRGNLIIEFGVLLYFVFSACYALLWGVEAENVYRQLSFVVYFPLLFVVQRLPRDVSVELFRQVLLVGSVIVIGTFSSILLFPLSVAIWNTLGETYRLGFIGVQNIDGEIFPIVYYRWSMWLIPAFVLSVGRHNISALVIGIAGAMTLSTSVIAFSLLGTVLLIFALRIQRSYSLKTVIYLVILTVGAVVVATMFYEVSGTLFEKIVSKLSTDSESTLIKVGHIEGVLQSMQTTVMNLLFGTGVGSEFYSPGTQSYTINIEVSHFNFVRQFGLIGGAIFFGYVFYVIASAYHTDALGKRWAIGLLMLFGAAGTNPLLMSPVFMVVLMTVRAYIVCFRMEKTYGLQSESVNNSAGTDFGRSEF